jgi:nucleotide-binding universal stress UspA family protein
MSEAIARILVPVDFSAPSDRALRYATTLADRFGATIELLHVVEDPFVSGAWNAEVYVPNVAELLNRLIVTAREQLEESKALVADKGIGVDTTVITGRPAQSIVDHAATERFDLIVLGTHGRTGLSHALLGSVAERVVRKAPCPVLTVREAAPATQEDASRAAVAVA